MGTMEVFALASLVLGIPPQTAVERPVSVYVFAGADEDTEEGEALAEVVREVEKRMKSRKKMFRVEEERDDALVLVELLRLWEEEVAQESYQPMNTNDPSRVPIHQYLSVGKTQFAEVEVRVGEDTPVRATASKAGRRPKDVADAIRTVVELHLVQYR